MKSIIKRKKSELMKGDVLFIRYSSGFEDSYIVGYKHKHSEPFSGGSVLIGYTTLTSLTNGNVDEYKHIEPKDLVKHLQSLTKKQPQLQRRGFYNPPIDVPLISYVERFPQSKYKLYISEFAEDFPLK